MSTILEEAEVVLRDADGPLHYRELAQRMVARGNWSAGGTTPAHQVVNSSLSISIARQGIDSPFIRTSRGVFGLRLRDQPGNASGMPDTSLDSNWEPANEDVVDPRTAARLPKELSFTDAAEQVLETYGAQSAMHYKRIAELILENELATTEAQVPEASLYAQIVYETDRSVKRGDTPRFVRYGRGLFGLSRWMKHGLEFEIERRNRQVKEDLKERLLQMAPVEFEALIGQLLIKLGFANVEVTGRSGDGGIDVRGVLVVGDVIRTNMAVQVKRWKANVQSPVVQQVRGSLDAHDKGLIITTSDFSSGARLEAARTTAIPVALMNGEQLVALLTEYEIGVVRTETYLLAMSSFEPEDE